MWSGVGGSTVLWAAHWVRMLPSDFRVKSLDGIADDWPFTYEDLLPFYREVENEFSVSGLGGDPAYPDGAEMPLPPLPIGKMGRKAAEGMDKLGWHWWPGVNAIASRPHGHLKQCGLRGTCLTGCPDRREGLHRPDPLARRDRGRRPAGHRCTGPRDHRQRRRVWRAEPPTSTGTARNTTSAVRPSLCAPTGWGHPTAVAVEIRALPGRTGQLHRAWSASG